MLLCSGCASSRTWLNEIYDVKVEQITSCNSSLKRLSPEKISACSLCRVVCATGATPAHQSVLFLLFIFFTQLPGNHMKHEHTFVSDEVMGMNVLPVMFNFSTWKRAFNRLDYISSLHQFHNGSVIWWCTVAHGSLLTVESKCAFCTLGLRVRSLVRVRFGLDLVIYTHAHILTYAGLWSSSLELEYVSQLNLGVSQWLCSYSFHLAKSCSLWCTVWVHFILSLLNYIDSARTCIIVDIVAV